MRRVLRLLLGQFDLFVTDIEAEFRDEYENGLAATAATRIETINKVLANTLDDEVASSELRYPLHSTHVGVVAWSNGEPSPVTDATVRQATSALLSAFGTYHNLLVPVGAGAVWAWGTLPGTQLDMSSIPPMPSDIDIAVGQPAAGMAGFCASHLEARAVERLLLLSAHPAGGGVTYHHDTALAILMAADLNAARVFLRRTLGQLVEDDPRMSETRATLRAYLDEGRSLAKAAQRLQIARNTVTYRIHRAEELSGTSLSTHHLLMHAALVLHDYIDIGGG
jgi:DNA-binding PucR family transcriptional regulator